MFIRIRFIPNIAAACIGGLVVVAILGTTLVSSAANKSAQFVSTYGKALSTLAAKQAVDATFNHDLVRLQVILQDVVDNPHAVFSTIHDVENNLLVQAGKVRGQVIKGNTYTSPIILHDSVAGYVSVTVDAEPWSLATTELLLITLGILLIALAAWSLMANNALSWEKHVKAPVDKGLTNSLTKTPGYEDEDLETADSVAMTPTPIEAKVYAIVMVKNFDVLQQQLNGPNFRETLSGLERKITEVLALYNGFTFTRADNFYLLKFCAETEGDDAIFHAVCSAHLVLELAAIINNIPLDLAALVSTDSDKLSTESFPFSGLTLDTGIAEDKAVKERLELMTIDENDNRRLVSGFNQPYRSLLDNQREQLKEY